MTATAGRVVVVQSDAGQLPFPDSSVDLICTSPPYFGLRSYTDNGEHYANQVGGEDTPAAYIDRLVTCTDEWMRVLKPSGSIFVNLGDKYSQSAAQWGGSRRGHAGALGGTKADDATRFGVAAAAGAPRMGVPKSLMGLPWRYALRCIDDLGLILRAEIIWNKPNGLPESVQDRVRRSHEQWFHFTKCPRYYSAVDEIRETGAPQQSGAAGTFKRSKSSHDLVPGQTAKQQRFERPDVPAYHPLGKLPGSVWTIPTSPLTAPAHLGVDHFAAFPPEIVRQIILGWSPSGVCTACQEGRRPVIGSVGLDSNRPQARRAQQLADEAGLTEAHFAALLSVGVSDTGRGAATQSGTGKNTAEVYVLAAEARAALGGYAREYLLRRPTSFGTACGCPDTAAPATPSLVVDPFGGTGTTALVASCYGRTGVSVDLSHDYSRMAAWRVSDPKERTRASRVRVDGKLIADPKAAP